MSVPDPGDPLTAIILAVLCNRQPDKQVRVTKAEYDAVSRGLQLQLQSDATSAWVTLVPKR